LIESEPHTDGTSENASRATEQHARTLLPDDVIDVVDALRGSAEPMFTDDVHHNEAGARLIAEAIYERIGDDLERMSGAHAP
jgi:lysophospholipase L1-like esterase